MNTFAEKVSGVLVRRKIITEEDRAYYRYGLECVFIYVINAVTMFLAAWCTGLMKEYIFFLIFFAPLRSHAGGIHMSTWQGCCIMSNIVVCLLTFISGQIPENVVTAVTAIVLMFLAVCGIWIWSPCENENNPLPEDVRQKCKIKARFWSIAICLVAVFCIYMGITSYAFMCVEMELLSVLLIGLEKIINLRKRGKKYEDSSM